MAVQGTQTGTRGKKEKEKKEKRIEQQVFSEDTVDRLESSEGIGLHTISDYY